MSKQLPFSGGILTGGLARRFQTAGAAAIDKGLLDLAGQPLVAHMALKLKPYTALPLLISANRHQAVYQRYGEVVADPADLAGYQGPLAGVLAMLGVMSTDWLLVLPVDSPFLPAALIDALWQAQLEQPAQRIFYVQHERAYPLCMLVHQETAPALAAYLHAGQRRVQSWLAAQGAVAVDLRHYAAEAFFNINTPADLQQAHYLLKAPMPKVVIGDDITVANSGVSGYTR